MTDNFHHKKVSRKGAKAQSKAPDLWPRKNTKISEQDAMLIPDQPLGSFVAKIALDRPS
jgi:hypothetical protein